MELPDCRFLPRCTIDFPLEITSDEITGLAAPVNMLLKSTYLMGTYGDIAGTLQSLFDIAEEIAGVDGCAYAAWDSGTGGYEFLVSRGFTAPDSADSDLYMPVEVARHLGRAAILDADRSPVFKRACALWGFGSLVCFPLRRSREFIGALVFGKRSPGSFTPVQAKLLWVLSMQAESHLHQSETVKVLSFYSFLDPLTHLYNRRYFDEQLEREILRSRRNGKPFSLLMLDLDGFKSYNDRFHHAAGDIALQEFATILRDSLREVDTVARLGGDEFAVILVESGGDGALDLARRISDRLSRHLLPGTEAARTERLSVSIGIASFPADAFDRRDLLRKADRALYTVKSQGGGRICLFHEITALLSLRNASDDIPVQKIYDAGRSVVDVDKFLEILLFTAMQGLGAGRGSIVVPDPGGRCLLRAAIGHKTGEDRLHPGIAVNPGEVTSWVVEKTRPLVHPGEEEFIPSRPLRRDGYRSETFMALPLLHEDRLVGILNLTNRPDRRPFSREDAATFAPMAARIASILHEGTVLRDGVRDFSTSTLLSLAGALELRFPFLSGHGERVSDLCLRAARRLGLPPAELSALRTAARLHDVGLVGIPGAILSKKRRLGERELEVARKHSFLGQKLLEGVPGAEGIRRMVVEHHERFDGSGYPYGLRGEEISPGSRIVAVAEFYDAIISPRPHRGGLRREEALQLVRNGMKSLFDPDAARAFLEALTGPGSSSSPGPELESCS